METELNAALPTGAAAAMAGAPLAIKLWAPLQGWRLAWLAAALAIALQQGASGKRSLWLALTGAGCLLASACCWLLPFPRGRRGRQGSLPQPTDGEATWCEATRNGTTRCVRRGQSPSADLVVLVHGMSTPLEVYDPLVDALVKDGFETFAFDLYGRGWSSADDALQTVPLFMTQLEDLLAASPIPEDRRFHIIGLSMGGPIVSSFASQHKERILSITWIGPLVQLPPLKELGPAAWVPQLAALLYARKFDGAADFRSEAQDWKRHESWNEKFVSEVITAGLERNEAARRSVASTLYGEVLLSLLQGDEKRHRAMHLAAAKIGVKILLVQGTEDKAAPFRHAKRLAEDASTLMTIGGPSAVELMTVEGAGHYPHLDQRELVNNRVLAHLRLGSALRH